jgi:hypothetical protein
MVDPIANILPQPPRPDYGHGRRGPRGPRGRRGRRGHDFARTCAWDVLMILVIGGFTGLKNLAIL